MKVDFTNMGILKFNEAGDSYFLRFRIINKKLYVYDSFTRRENCKYIEVIKINGIPISKMLEKGFTEPDFSNYEKMMEYGIDIYNRYNITFKKLNPHFFDIYGNKNLKKIFFKTHDKNKVLDSKQFKKLKPTKGTDCLMADYAITSAKGILTMLYNMSKTEEDKALFLNVFNTFHSANETIIDVENYMDMVYLSTALLLNDSKFSYIPETVVELINRSHNSYKYPIYLVGDVEHSSQENNDSIITDGEVDTRKLLNMLRNQLAHSNYQMLSDNYIKVFNLGKKNRLNIEIAKKKVMYMLKKLCDFHAFDNIFPVIDCWLAHDYNPFTEVTLRKYLDDLKLYTPNKIKFKILEDEEQQLNLEDHQGLDVANFKNISKSAFTKDSITYAFNRTIKKHLTDDCKLEEEVLSNEIKNRIMQEIELLGKDYFYSLSKGTQLEVINKIIQKLYDRNQTYLRVAYDYIEKSSGFKNEALNSEASSYIDYLALIELSIISLLNSIFLYTSNQNEKAIDGTCFRFPDEMYQSYLDIRIKKLEKYSKTKIELSDQIKKLLNVISNYHISAEIANSLTTEIDNLNNKIIKLRGQIGALDTVLNKGYNADSYDIANKEIIRRIRDSLAHGRLTIESIDLNDIGGTILHIVDEYNNEIEFDGYVTLRDLLNSINKLDLITSLINDNNHFNNHSLSKKA